ncbi:MAG: hypothetical protein COB66_06415 [Coxiella sp. (in: Bacteria)]|nr:MAG: hypothetical protein COB66_06415 [Coxiella sp. (in: g-proteobacteria)]
MNRQSGFALFEVLIAWLIFISAFSILSFVQLKSLKRLRQSYLKELSVIQLLTISEYRQGASPDRWARFYREWHTQNTTYFSHEKDRWYSNGKKACFEIEWGLLPRKTRYCR